MEIILLEKIRNLGNLGDKVNVKPGFGRNYLLPEGKALSATEANLKRFEARRQELEAAANESLQAAQTRADALKDLHIQLRVRAGDEGKLFGSIGPIDLADAISKESSISISRQEVRLPQGGLRQLGEYAVEIQLHGDITVNIKVSLLPE